MRGPLPVVVLDAELAPRRWLVEAVHQAARQCGREVSVFEAEDGAGGARLIAREDPALVVGEVLLDKFSGLALLRQIQRHRSPDRRPAFVFVSQLDTETDHTWALRQGANAYFAKPCDRDTLVQTLVDCLVTAPKAGNHGPS